MGFNIKKDQWIKNTWRTDLLLPKMAIILNNKTQFNEKGVLKGREHMKKIGIKYNIKKIFIIDTDKWKAMKEEEKRIKIDDIVRENAKASILGQ